MGARLLTAALLLLLTACSQPTLQESEFMHRLSALCGKAFEGKIVSIIRVNPCPILFSLLKDCQPSG